MCMNARLSLRYTQTCSFVQLPVIGERLIFTQCPRSTCCCCFTYSGFLGNCCLSFKWSERRVVVVSNEDACEETRSPDESPVVTWRVPHRGVKPLNSLLTQWTGLRQLKPVTVSTCALDVTGGKPLRFRHC